MEQVLDLAAYLNRIGYAGPTRPNLALLTAIHRLHPAAIAFENLDPLLGRPPKLDLASLQAKLIRGGRGGYCYEHNSLLKAALEALGFTVTALAARVMWRVPPEAGERPRSHMLLKVDLDEDAFIADVGFGGMVMSAPLRLAAGPIQHTPHEPYRLIERTDGLALEVRLGGDDWRSLYSFTLEPQIAADFEVMNWFTATHPNSPFTFALMAARATDRGRVALADNRLTIRPKDRAPEERILQTVEALADVLRTEFGVSPPTDLDRLAGRIGLRI